VTRVDAQGFVLDTDAGFGDAMVARLKKFLLRSKVEIERLEWRCLALRGAGVDEARPGCAPRWPRPACWPCRSSGTDGPGSICSGPRTWSSTRPGDPLPTDHRVREDAVEACRIVSGIPAMGSELTDKTIAAEAGDWWSGR
jgi:folate-binding Fe-S cluster repair protein YgfZ